MQPARYPARPPQYHTGGYPGQTAGILYRCRGCDPWGDLLRQAAPESGSAEPVGQFHQVHKCGRHCQHADPWEARGALWLCPLWVYYQRHRHRHERGIREAHLWAIWAGKEFHHQQDPGHRLRNGNH